jgi:hypothetical protein
VSLSSTWIFFNGREVSQTLRRWIGASASREGFFCVGST